MTHRRSSKHSSSAPWDAPRTIPKLPPAEYLRDNSPDLLAQVLLMSNELMFVD